MEWVGQESTKTIYIKDTVYAEETISDHFYPSLLSKFRITKIAIMKDTEGKNLHDLDRIGIPLPDGTPLMEYEYTSVY